MSFFYTGIINLSRIPKELIKENRNGEKIIYVDFAERKSPSMYGDTHYLKLYDVTNKTTHYIGDFRPKEIGGRVDAPAPAPAAPPAPEVESLEPQEGDLPF